MMRSILSSVVLLGLCQPVLSHDWYAKECCSGKDCKPVPNETVRWEGNGWRYLPFSLFFPKERARDSQDDKIHVCIQPGPFPGTWYPRCIYLAPGL